ncbi:MAG: hypothetical protein EHM42_11110 [Planctomycetaceae bacterium]|nr:MAG: hypothetical protein EHM42_11110 [Planctomycetaceae bacterium]
METSTITAVERSTVWIAGTQQPLEFPRVSTLKASVRATVKPDQTLVLGGPVQHRAGEKPTAIIVLLKARPVFDSPAPARATPAPVPESSRATTPARITSLSAKGDRRELALSLQRWMLKINSQSAGDRSARLDINSGDNETRIQGSGRVAVQLTSADVRTEVPPELEVQADWVQILETAVEEPVAAHASGREVRIVLRGNVVLQASRVGVTCDAADLRVSLPAGQNPPTGSLKPAIRAHLTGQVQLVHNSASAGRGESKIQADQITLPFLDGKFLQMEALPSPKPETHTQPRVLPFLPQPVPDATAVPRRTIRDSVDSQMQTRTYAVADLVVPLPGTPSTVRSSPQEVPTETNLATVEFVNFDQVGAVKASPLGDKPAVDFAPLRTLIETTIAPESWKSAGGSAQIQPYPESLSLIIRQTSSVHQQIATLLEDLRREQDVQVTLELKLVRFPDNDWTTRLNWIETSDKLVEGLTLTSQRAAEFLRLSQSDKRVHATQFPKLTLFNEQVADFQVPASDDTQSSPLGVALGVVVDNDRRRMRLNLACNTSSRDEALTASRSYRLTAGESLLIDIGPDVSAGQNIVGVPILSKVPFADRLFKNANAQSNVGKPTLPLMLLVTPRILVVEEADLQSSDPSLRGRGP